MGEPTGLRRARLWVPALLYMGAIFHLSSESNPLPSLTSHVWDKVLHLSEYAGLAFLLCRALAGEGLSWLAAAAVAVLATTLYGASDEWHQAFVPLRSSDIRDWFADSLGALIGATAFRMTSKHTASSGSARAARTTAPSGDGQ
jgi:VanZ family protein